MTLILFKCKNKYVHKLNMWKDTKMHIWNLRALLYVQHDGGLRPDAQATLISDHQRAVAWACRHVALLVRSSHSWRSELVEIFPTSDHAKSQQETLCSLVARMHVDETEEQTPF